MENGLNEEREKLTRKRKIITSLTAICIIIILAIIGNCSQKTSDTSITPTEVKIPEDKIITLEAETNTSEDASIDKYGKIMSKLIKDNPDKIKYILTWKEIYAGDTHIFTLSYDSSEKVFKHELFMPDYWRPVGNTLVFNPENTVVSVWQDWDKNKVLQVLDNYEALFEPGNKDWDKGSHS